MTFWTDKELCEHLERAVKAWERIADALEALAPIAIDTSFDPNDGTIDFESPNSAEVESQSRKVSERDIIEGEKDAAY